MTPTKYAIRCSTEEQGYEVGKNRHTAISTKQNEIYYKNKGYTIISYEQAKELGLLGEHYQDTINKLSVDSEKKHNWENCDCETCGDFRGFNREHHQHDINTSSIDDEKETTEQQSEDIVEKIIKEVSLYAYKTDRMIGTDVQEIQNILRKHLSSK